MKSWLISLILGLSFGVQADEFLGLITHDVLKDGFAQGGNIFIRTIDLPVESNSFEVKISYDLDVRVLFFNRNVKGEETIQMPNAYRTEQGFIDLERDGVYRDPKVNLFYKGRTNWGEYYDCHLVELDPALHNRWEGEFVQCTDAPKSGIVQLKMIIKDIPLLGQGTVLSKWNRR